MCMSWKQKKEKKGIEYDDVLTELTMRHESYTHTGPATYAQQQQ